MHALDLIHPDDDITREYLTRFDVEYAQVLLDEGRDPAFVYKTLKEMSQNNQYEAECDADDYRRGVGYYDNID